MSESAQGIKYELWPKLIRTRRVEGRATKTGLEFQAQDADNDSTWFTPELAYFSLSLSMARLSLTAYLIAAAWLGPALCCCSVRQFASGCGSCHAFVVKTRPHSHSHCHGHRHGGDDSAPAPVKPQPHAPCDCPCDRHSVQQIALLEQNSFDDSFGIGVDLLLIAPAPALDVVSCVQVGGLAIEQLSLESPYWNSEGILRAHHVLRC